MARTATIIRLNGTHSLRDLHELPAFVEYTDMELRSLMAWIVAEGGAKRLGRDRWRFLAAELESRNAHEKSR